MARGTTGANLVAMLKAEMGDFSGTNSVRDAELLVLLSNKQKWLATEYEWPFLERRWDTTVAPSQQYVALPDVDDLGDTSKIDFERMPLVEVKWVITWRPIEYGIGAAEYNAIDLARGQRTDPIQRWRLISNVNETSSPDEYEVWPVPTTNQVMRFTGQRTLKPLTSTVETADLDDMLLVLFVAADQLIRMKQPDAQTKLQMAQRRLQMIKQNYPTRDKLRNLAEGYRQRKLVGIRIAVAGAGLGTEGAGVIGLEG